MGSLKDLLTNVWKPRYFPTDASTHVGSNYFAVQSSSALQPQDLQSLLVWARQIANAMEYLHSVGIFHADLAPRNILLAADQTIKLCDFGLSQKCLSGRDYARLLEEVR